MKKNIIFVSLIISAMIADSLDNAIIEELQKNKEQKRSEKQQNKQKTQENNIRNINKNKVETKNEIIKNIESQTKQKNKDVSKDSQDTRQQSGEVEMQEIANELVTQPQTRETIKKQPLWNFFLGGYLGGQYKANYKGNNAQIFNVSLQGGIFYNIGSTHGLKGYIFASYNSLNQNNLFSAGAGADYFYDFHSIGLGIFAGIYTDIPFNRSILRELDLIISTGMSMYINRNNRIELRIGYPILQDPQIKRILLLGINYQYIFNAQNF
ncbi:hypothetical protein CQA53_04780 [Helicobacter didelphidarum]|uniref:Uncharacterized protein n=1 Tax=Helicobacter didelphidarum TaxID=2040648 RepID=A0A3D8IMD0_9HELI|nr:hypothetical protein [Helicobacter didelphidarum]RDU66115.1 hypothetical protein CQA53_04780 [Helicobacter didelphidarum]